MMGPGRKRRAMRFQRTATFWTITGHRQQSRSNPGPPAGARFAHRSGSHGKSARKTSASTRANPAEKNQPVQRRVKIDPTEWQFRREMHALHAHGGNRRPGRSSKTFAAKLWSMVMITSGFHNSTCSIEKLASPPRLAACDVLRDELDRLHVDRAAEPGLELARPAGAINARPSVGLKGTRCFAPCATPQPSW